jgi:hypothetical protein
LLKKDAFSGEVVKLLIDTLIKVFQSYADGKQTDAALDAAYIDAKLITPLRYKSWDKVD